MSGDLSTATFIEKMKPGCSGKTSFSTKRTMKSIGTFLLFLDSQKPNAVNKTKVVSFESTSKI